MRKVLVRIICFLFVSGAAPYTSAHDLTTQNYSIAHIKDAVDVSEAVARITSTLEQQGFEIALVVDHAAAAGSVELELAPTQIIFARPPRFLEKHLLRRSPTVGLDLPFKFLVFEDDGEIQIRFNSIGYLIERHDLALRDFLLNLIDAAVEQFGGKESGLITIASLHSTEETLEALKAEISMNPAFRIPLILDFNADRGKKRPFPILVVFGNPNVGTPLMQTDQHIGIDLPQKFLIWEDEHGGVSISYNDPSFIAKRHNIQGQDARLEMMSNALRRFALTAAGKRPDN